ncbi:hypothetical protein ACFL34_05885 [Candidatus Sumerlaeota bacterium]
MSPKTVLRRTRVFFECMAGEAVLRNNLLAYLFFAMVVFCFFDLVCFSFGVAITASPYFVALFTVFSVFLLIRLGQLPSRSSCVLVSAILLICAFSVRYVEWDTRKSFILDLNRIRPGMTRGEVNEIMANYIRGTSWYTEEQGVRVESALVFMHTDDPLGPSCDGGIVMMKDGRVVSADFVLD